jgi:hypothetical protein
MVSDGAGPSAQPTNIESRSALHWDLNDDPQLVRSSQAIDCSSQGPGSAQSDLFNTARGEE